jgi:hypothetical protein
MRIGLILIALAASCGCAELHRPALGTRVRQFQVHGRPLVHCSILMDPSKPEQSHDAIEVCQDALGQRAHPLSRP